MGRVRRDSEGGRRGREARVGEERWSRRREVGRSLGDGAQAPLPACPPSVQDSFQIQQDPDTRKGSNVCWQAQAKLGLCQCPGRQESQSSGHG
jgi:hypothetical protein